MSDRTILITGGTGFIGAYTAAEAVSNGDSVVAFDISADSRIFEKLGIADQVEIIEGDITETTSVFEAVKETSATHIIHLAAFLTNRSNQYPRKSIDINIKGTNTVFEAARVFDTQIERVVWASSSAVYAPQHRYDDPDVDEDDLVYPATLYGAAKEYNEHQADIYRENYDLSLIGLRPTLVYGPYRESGSASAYAQVIEGPARENAVEVGPSDFVFDWQYAADAGAAFYGATLTPESELSYSVYNICGERATLAEVADVVHKYLPDADITLTDEGDAVWNHHMKMNAAKEELGYDPEYGLERGVKAYIDVVRENAGLDPV
ncbi:NAD-dependent epimerase/dehydratase family protein [Halobellus litoreus]|uniref:NAD-dependent epimerase/dehydratase family protein n=1 Tax=Halobellus litoreus TaxID=755310 RepID=A0ABD6E4Q5_9EURY|nr:NAD(P)-dependent oxidoreductase [Halobellus litoreus]